MVLFIRDRLSTTMVSSSTRREAAIREETVLREAEFNPRVRSYWLLYGALILTLTLFGIVLLPIWFWVGHAITARYLRRLRCTLTDRSLKMHKGWLVRVEKTVPLDKITDLGLVQGPIMRYYELEALSVETAGQSTPTPGALVNLTGIVGAREFRDAVLEQRDVVVAALGSGEAPQDPESSLSVLKEIRDSLRRIEESLPRQ